MVCKNAGAGAFGAAIKNGIQRGLFSNEAGSGSVPQAAASASPQPNHPATQGYVQMLGVFLDTMVLCTSTAVIILLADTGSSVGMEGIRLTQNAMEFHLGGFGSHFVTAAITLFAFTSIVANYVYAESNLHFFKLDNRGRTHSIYLSVSTNDLMGVSSYSSSNLGNGRYGSRSDDGDQRCGNITADTYYPRGQ